MGAFESIPNDVVSALFGDYNRNGAVDAADYTVWRNTLGTSGLTPYSGADGDGDGTVTGTDYGVWKSHFGSEVALPAPLEAKSAAGSGDAAESTFVTDAAFAVYDSPAPQAGDVRPIGQRNSARATRMSAADGSTGNQRALLLLLHHRAAAEDSSLKSDASQRRDKPPAKSVPATLELSLAMVLNEWPKGL